MPKKSAAARGGAQRYKAKAQKSFEIVRPVDETLETSEALEAQETLESSERLETPEKTEVAQAEVQATPEPARAATKTQAAAAKTAKAVKKTAVAPSELRVEDNKEETRGEAQEELPASTLHKGSAAARLAARRQAAQRAQQRSAATLITAEHFAYVRRDLITIGILAVIMFAAIIVLYFTIGRA